jgi:hypothetical protein
VLALVALALYAYFIRPHTGTIVMADYWYAGSQIPFTDHENLVRLGWYLSPLGIALAVTGCVVILLKERWEKLWPFWAVGGGFTVLYIYNIFNNPFHIYAMRRYVPVVVPFFMLAAAYAFSWLWWHRNKFGRLISLALLLMLSGWLIYNGRLIWGQVEYQGAIAQVKRVADRLEKQAIVLFVDDSSLGLGSILGTPLQFLYQMTAFDLQEEQLDTALLKQQVNAWSQANRPVYIIQDPNAATQLLSQCRVLTGTLHLDVPQLETSYTHAPTKVLRMQYDVELYRIDRSCP